MYNFIQPSRVQILTSAIFLEKEVEVFVLRDDLIHPLITGNKWRKLKYNIEYFFANKKKRLVTYGGAYSNHILAVAECCKLLNIDCSIVIRNDEGATNSLLNYIRSCGAQLIFIPRSLYKERNAVGFNELIFNTYLQALNCNYDDVFFIPEGGANNLGINGCKEIVADLKIDFNFILTACGTATTLQGIISELNISKQCLAIPVLKGADFLEDELKLSSINFSQTHFFYDYHFGGYAKWNDELISFCEWFNKSFAIPVEPIYTGKMFFAFFDLLKKNYFPKGSKIVLYHSGGVHCFTTPIFL